MNPSTSPMKAPRSRSYVTCVICRLKRLIICCNQRQNLLINLIHAYTHLIVKLIYMFYWNFDLICQPHGRRVIRTLKAIATVLQTAVDLHLYRSPRRCVRDSNPRGFYTQTVFKTAPSTCRTRNINLPFQIVRPDTSHFLIINQNQSGYLAQSRVIETQSCRITRLSRSVPHLVNLLCRIGEGSSSSPQRNNYTENDI